MEQLSFGGPELRGAAGAPRGSLGLWELEGFFNKDPF